jgi:tetratricopeptide (TPR) repeat protein
LAFSYFGLGQYDQAIERLAENLVLLTDDQLPKFLGGAGFQVATSRAWLASCLAERGQFTEARTLAEQAEQVAVALDHPFTLVQALVARAIVCSRQGEPTAALAPLQHALAICHEQQVDLLLPWVSLELGHAYALLGRCKEALALLKPVLEWLAQMPGLAREQLAAIWLAEAYLAAGSHSEASTHAEQTLAYARARGERGNEARALRLKGEIAAQADPPDVEQAEARYHEALALAEKLGMRPLMAHCHVGLGTLYQKVGRDDEAHAELATAAEMYRSMEMTFWLEQAERAFTEVKG